MFGLTDQINKQLFGLTNQIYRNIINAIQVSCYLKKNKDREIAGLLEAIEMYGLKEGLILTLDDEEEITINNKKITIKPVWKWMLENE